MLWSRYQATASEDSMRLRRLSLSYSGLCSMYVSDTLIVAGSYEL
jgi:hypothetical protein